ncbi:MAG: PP2C family protein-serine/threonine phosphatase, partial [Actinomycetes bacterium]
EIATAALEPADRVLFYTDGVSEGRNLDGEPFGEARLADLLVRETLAGQPAAETMRRLAHAILAHQGRTPHDDATMVLLEWSGPPVEFPVAGPRSSTLSRVGAVARPSDNGCGTPGGPGRWWQADTSQRPHPGREELRSSPRSLVEVH